MQVSQPLSVSTLQVFGKQLLGVMLHFNAVNSEEPICVLNPAGALRNGASPVFSHDQPLKTFE